MSICINRPLLWDFICLMRLDKPVGTFLLLWPTLGALWLASHGTPPPHLALIMVTGVVVMRAAGCVINDIADRNIDKHVQRTQHRPLTSGRLQLSQAVILFSVLCSIAFILLLMLNPTTWGIAVCALFLTLLYPFTKRFFSCPQLVLSIVWSMGILMAYAAVEESLPLLAFVFFAANVFLTLAYDSMYALVDYEDDIKIGVHSSAVLFGIHTPLFIGIMQILCLISLCLVGAIAQLSWIYWSSLLLIAILMCAQQRWISMNIKSYNFKAFLSNQWLSLIVFLGILCSDLFYH